MNTSEIKKHFDEAIKAYQLQIDNESYNEYGVEAIMRAYQLAAPNIAGLPNPVLVILGIAFVDAVVNFEMLKSEHELSDEIYLLEAIRNNLTKKQIEEYQDEEVLMNYLAKKKAYRR